MNLHDILTQPNPASASDKARGGDSITVSLRGTEVTASSPEGKTASMPLDAFMAKLAPRSLDTGGVVLPDGIKSSLACGPMTVWAYERPPCVQRFLWIAPDSPVPYGRGAKYRTVRLALPYLIILAVFAADSGGHLQLTGFNECFFRTEPFKSLEDPLCYPALLNCSRFEPPAGRPLSWICTQHLKPTPIMRDPDVNQRLPASFEALRHVLLETGFNLSSEHHEFSSWFSESQKIDPRLNSVEAWEAASTENPLFVLEVPWLPTGHTVRQVADRIFKNHQAAAKGAAAQSVGSLARIVFNHK